MVDFAEGHPSPEQLRDTLRRPRQADTSEEWVVKTIYLVCGDDIRDVGIRLPESLSHRFDGWLIGVEGASERFVQATRWEIYEAMVHAVVNEDPDIISRYDPDSPEVYADFVQTAMNHVPAVHDHL